MKYRNIITISRQYGSGGRLIGQKLAKKLDIPFYDKELISLAAKESGYSEDLFEHAEEKATNSFMYALSMGSYMFSNNVLDASDMPLDYKVYNVQSKIIQEIAKKGSCIIIGRCADYVLNEDLDCTNVFIYSDIKNRIERVIKEYDIPDKNAEEVVIKTDKKRATYYNYYTGKKWGKYDNYHLSLNSDTIGIDNTVEIIKSFVTYRMNNY